jgi:prevent-host-death family protein
MSLKVSVRQLQKNLPEILDRAVAENDVCLVERDGENVAVIVSLRLWQQHRTVGAQLDALGAEYRLDADRQQRAEELLAKKRLTRAEEKELAALLKEADEITLRRAEALDRL